MTKSLITATTLILVSTSAFGDGLADLRGTLARLTARESIRVSITVESNSRDGDDAPPEVGKSTFDAEDGPQGLRVTYTPELLARARQEARERSTNPDKPTPTLNGMRRVDPAELIESLDAAGPLLRMLDSAVLLKEQRTQAGGRSLRQLTMKITPKLSTANAKRVRSVEVTLVVSLDDDGTPLTAEVRQKLKAKFLLMTFETDSHRTWKFARHGDRLVALRHMEQSTGKGMGQKFENTQIITVVPKSGAI